MAKQAKKKAATKKRGRVKTGKLNKQAQEMTAGDMKKVKGGTFNLQQIQQTLNRVNETVTNLSRSQSDAEKSITQNLSV
jgi:hypothetical protein